MLRALILAALVAGPLAGCLGSAPPLAPAASGAPGAPSLLEPPRWEVGEWWTFEGRMDWLGGAPVEGRLVVADATDDDYLVGMPSSEWNDLLLLGHYPPIGLVDREDFGLFVHNEYTELLRFPLRDGDHWETTWNLGPAVAAVTQTGPYTADIAFSGGLFSGTVTYDARERTITKYDIPGYGVVEMTGHGYGYAGRVVVPVEQDLAVFHGRALGAVDVSTPPLLPAAGGVAVGVPVDRVEVGHRDAASVAQFVGNFGLVPTPPAPGFFYERTQTPDGNVRETMRTPADGEGLTLNVWKMGDPGGEWVMTHGAGGSGLAVTEALIYDELSYDVGATA